MLGRWGRERERGAHRGEEARRPAPPCDRHAAAVAPFSALWPPAARPPHPPRRSRDPARRRGRAHGQGRGASQDTRGRSTKAQTRRQAGSPKGRPHRRHATPLQQPPRPSPAQPRPSPPPPPPLPARSPAARAAPPPPRPPGPSAAPPCRPTAAAPAARQAAPPPAHGRAPRGSREPAAQHGTQEKQKLLLSGGLVCVRQ
jgi:hypothetical protein